MNAICKASMQANFKITNIIVIIYACYCCIGAMMTSSFVSVVSCAISILIYFLITHLYKKRIDSCTLTLYEKNIDGQINRLFSNDSLNLPINKIDSIFIRSRLLDKLRGGKTIVIRSASGIIKFPCIENAEEFVNITLAEIQKWNDKKKAEPVTTTIEAKNNDAFEDIQKLKALLDQGLITQKEYDEKRQELINRI